MNIILKESFLKKYKDAKPPLSDIGEFVYLRTYSRYLPEKKRRETWFETVKRVVEYNIQLGVDFKSKNGIDIDIESEQREAELFFDNLFNLKTFPSGRTLYMGGTEVVKEYPLSNYNCCFTKIECFNDFADMFYLLMLGSGVGARIDKKLINRLPKVRKVKLIDFYNGDIGKYTPKKYKENTTLVDSDNDGEIIIRVGDSKEGWCDAIIAYFNILTFNEYEHINTIIVDYSYVRPEGARLKRFGGRASGHKSLKRMFEKINKVTSSRNGQLQSIDILDIATIISENVVSGGVRRSSMIILCDKDDVDIINAKKGLYKVVDGEWIEDKTISHRRMSNNSVLYNETPTMNEIKEMLESIRVNGEPAFINATAAKKRKSTFEGVNPCGEILLQPKQCCNLSTNNMMAFVEDDGMVWIDKMIQSFELSTRIAIRMTLVDIELSEWNKVMQDDRIIGISMTGIMDMFNKTKLCFMELGEVFNILHSVVHKEAERYCNELGIKPPELMTTIKPEGSISTLPCVSSGIHFSHSEYYVRRVRINTTDPLYKMVEKLGCYPIYNEVGQADDNCSVKVIEFPIKAPKGKTKYDVGAVEQLELYKLSMINWTDHNTSITVHVKDDEWDDVAKWLYENFEYVVGVTFLPLIGETYPLLPYESISKEEYEQRVLEVKPLDYELLAQFEDEEEHDIIDGECANGACPLR